MASEVDPILSSSGRRATLRSSGGASADAPATKRARVASRATNGGALPLFYEGDRSEQTSVRDSVWCNMTEDSEEYGSSSRELDMFIDSAMYGDPLVEHCLATGAAIAPIDPEPNTIKQAYSSPERDKWREAVEVELEMIRQFNVFSDPLPLPKGAIPLNCRWIFKRKTDHLGNVIKHKARLTPQGCFQHFGVDYSDTYAPVATLRYVLALTSLLLLQTSSCDFTNAFLNAELHEDVYINAPPGSPPLPEWYVYKLQRAL